MAVPDEEIFHAVTNVQKTCEDLVRGHGDGTAHLVTFEDGSASRLSDALARGRSALAELAGLFGTVTVETRHGR